MLLFKCTARGVFYCVFDIRKAFDKAKNDVQLYYKTDHHITSTGAFEMYKLYGGKYCLAYDAVPELSGVGTHNLNVKSSDGKKIAYSLYMFDSKDLTDTHQYTFPHYSRE